MCWSTLHWFIYLVPREWVCLFLFWGGGVSLSVCLINLVLSLALPLCCVLPEGKFSYIYAQTKFSVCLGNLYCLFAWFLTIRKKKKKLFNMEKNKNKMRVYIFPEERGFIEKNYIQFKKNATLQYFFHWNTHRLVIRRGEIAVWTDYMYHTRWLMTVSFPELEFAWCCICVCSLHGIHWSRSSSQTWWPSSSAVTPTRLPFCTTPGTTRYSLDRVLVHWWLDGRVGRRTPTVVLLCTVPGSVLACLCCCAPVL